MCDEGGRISIILAVAGAPASISVRDPRVQHCRARTGAPIAPEPRPRLMRFGVSFMRCICDASITAAAAAPASPARRCDAPRQKCDLGATHVDFLRSSARTSWRSGARTYRVCGERGVGPHRARRSGVQNGAAFPEGASRYDPRDVRGAACLPCDDRFHKATDCRTADRGGSKGPPLLFRAGGGEARAGLCPALEPSDGAVDRVATASRSRRRAC